MSSLISVVIPTHYRNELLEDAIDSVLAQDYEPLEVIVVDDSGEGNAVPVLEQYDDIKTIIREENGGWPVAYGEGIEAASGEYVHLLDDDDLFLDGKITKTADVVLNDPDVGVGFTGVKQDNGWQSTPDPEMSGNVLKPALRFETFPCWTGSMLIDRDILLDVLPLPNLPAANDANLIIELARRTQFDYVDEILTCNRRENSRIWVGMKRFEGMKRVLEIQSDLYDQYPELRQEVLADIYYQEGHSRLRNTSWTPRAIGCFARAATQATTTEDRFIYTSTLFASLLGRPGVRTAAGAKNFFKGLLSLSVRSVMN